MVTPKMMVPAHRPVSQKGSQDPFPDESGFDYLIFRIHRYWYIVSPYLLLSGYTADKIRFTQLS